MYYPNQNVTYTLFDKLKRENIRTFNSIIELRNFIGKCLVFRKDPLCNYTHDKVFEIDKLSMSLKPTYDYIVGYKYVYDDELKTTVLREYHNRYIKQEFVIIDNLGRIFNYTEMINELRAHCNGVKINFGIGKTYSGDAYTEPKQRWYPYFCGGHYTSKGSGSSRLAVNKAERIANNSNLNDEYYGDIADEIEENLNVTINLRDIKTVYNSMKNKRRMLADKGWGSVYSEQFCKYGRPENWKNHKKSKQWKHNHDVTKQTARKDSMRKYIDEEYYFDYELDDCG